MTAAVAAVGFPLVVKPSDSTGSQGVTVVRAEEGLVPAWERASAISSSVLLEEFLDGPQFSVEAFSEDGKHVVLAVTRTYSDPRTLVELGHVLPADLPEHQRAQFVERTAQLLDAGGLTFGPSHTEFVLTARGPVPIETHARVGGDDIYLMVADGVGVDMDALQVDQVFEDQVLDRLVPTTCSAQAIWFGVAEVVVPLEGDRAVPDPPGGPVDVAWLQSGVVPELRSSADRAFQVRAEAPAPSEALELARSTAERLAAVSGLSTRLAQLANVV